MIFYELLLLVLLLQCTDTLLTTNKVLSSSSRVKSVVVIVRHGDRTPRVSFPTDPHPVTDPSEWPDGVAQLTSAGRARVARLGHLIRHRFPELFAALDPLSDDDMLIQSSSTDRTMETARILASAISGHDRQSINMTADGNADRMLRNLYPNCSSADAAMDTLLSSREVQHFMDQERDLMQRLKQWTGMKRLNPLDVHDVQDVLQAEAESGKQLPSWATPDVIRRINRLTEAFFCVTASSRFLRRHFTGLIMNDLKKRLEKLANSSIANQDKRKLLVYASHNFLLQWLLWDMGSVQRLQAPAFAAAIIIQLRQEMDQHGSQATDKDFKVQAEYLQLIGPDQQMKHESLTMPSCHRQFACPFSQFFAHVQSFTVSDFDRECSERDPVDVSQAVDPETLLCL